ncbi:cupin domain-containing protein [Pseudotabrizicola algicola]|uniref:Cupin domain-containing protein n=1 Tax=Pseudotabrizicola algicola TaxID=2709381 RepID=A0A6B3RHB1_9RHOB|nr:cupin domain-containing protein [Pseudotabrizicola algicola]NEX44781.1 cupin domain-containing protein [Pseudotabrizicola algicola]
MTYPVVQTGEDVTRQVLADSPELMTVAFHFGAKGAIGAPHQHPHVQSTFVRSGRFRFTVAERTFEVGAGDAFVIPSNAVHGCICLEPGTLIDGFAPRRDDFL